MSELPRPSDGDLRAELAGALREVADGFSLYSDTEDRISREINIAISSALEQVADKLGVPREY